MSSMCSACCGLALVPVTVLYLGQECAKWSSRGCRAHFQRFLTRLYVWSLVVQCLGELCDVSWAISTETHQDQFRGAQGAMECSGWNPGLPYAGPVLQSFELSSQVSVFIVWESYWWYLGAFLAQYSEVSPNHAWRSYSVEIEPRNPALQPLELSP